MAPEGVGSTTTLADGQRLPWLGLGTWQLGSGRETIRPVVHALQCGYRLIDTAAVYGNEVEVGKALRQSGTAASEVMVTTKLWNDDQGRATTRGAFERSLQALGTDAVDLYLLHWPVERVRGQSWEVLQELQAEGLCRSIGVSNYTTAHLEQLLGGSDVVPAVNQVEFHPFLYQAELLQYCRGHRIQLQGYCPLARASRLSDPTLVAIGAAHGRSAAQVMLRWALQHQVAVIPKASHPRRIEENTAIFDFSLSGEEMSTLDGLSEGLRCSWDPTSMP